MSNSNILLSNSNPCRLYSSAMTKRGCHVSSFCVTCWCFSSSWFTCDVQPHGALSPPIAKSFCPYFQGVTFILCFQQKPEENSKTPVIASVSVCSDKTAFQSTQIIASSSRVSPTVTHFEATECALELKQSPNFFFFFLLL